MGRVRIRLDQDVLRLLLTEGHEVKARCCQGLSVDAKFVTMARDFDTHDFLCVYEDEAFPAVPEGQKIPELEVKWEAL